MKQLFILFAFLLMATFTTQAINHEYTEINIYSTIDTYSIDILQDCKIDHKQNDNYSKGFDKHTTTDSRFVIGSSESGYDCIKNADRQIDRKGNYQKIKICQTIHKTCWKYNNSGMYSGRIKRVDRIATRNYKPLPRNSNANRRHNYYSETVHTQNCKNISMDWRHLFFANSDRNYPKIC